MQRGVPPFAVHVPVTFGCGYFCWQSVVQNWSPFSPLLLSYTCPQAIAEKYLINNVIIVQVIYVKNIKIISLNVHISSAYAIANKATTKTMAKIFIFDFDLTVQQVCMLCKNYFYEKKVKKIIILCDVFNQLRLINVMINNI